MVDEFIEKVWRLRTDPFYPKKDDHGQPIEMEACAYELNPSLDDRVLPIYFDVYDWTHSLLVGGISREHVLTTFPTGRTLPRNEAMMILASGSMSTGLDSFANLVIHRIRRDVGCAPWIVEVKLDGRDRARNVALVATTLIRKLKYAKPPPPDVQTLVQSMREVFDEVHAVEEGRPNATYTEAFEAFSDLLKPIAKQIVVKIVGRGDSDSWERIYESVKHCSGCLLVLTDDELYAEICHKAMTANGANFAWVRALPLNREKAELYLRARIESARLAAQAAGQEPPLFPFTDDALAALYEPGSGSTLGRPVEHPVGKLRRTLGTAFENEARALAALRAPVMPMDLTAIDRSTAAIGPDAVKRAWHRHDRG